MIVFEMNNEDGVLEIHGTPAGLRELSEVISKLAEKPGDHDHLMTPSWSGDELGETPVSMKDTLINHVKICCWDALPQTK